MTSILIGGSRRITRLPAEVTTRLENVIARRHHVLVGDANGGDKAIQTYLRDASYEDVTVFASGTPRNNLRPWPSRVITPPNRAKGFAFHAAKDREMARAADFGLMIWDGKSPGTVLNILRLVRAGKIAVLFSVPDRRAINFKGTADWEDFLSHRDTELIKDLRERATPDEWQSGQQSSLLDTPTAAREVRHPIGQAAE